MRRLLLTVMLIFLGSGVMTGQETDDPTLTDPDRRITTGPSDVVAFGPDGTRVAVGGRDNVIRLYDVFSGELQAMLAGHESWVTHLAFSPDGERIISAGRDNSVRIWSADSYRQLNRLTHHTATVTGVAYSDNGLMVASASMDGTIWVGEAATGQTVASLTNYSGPVWSVAFSPDGRTLVSGSEDGTLWIWGLYDSSVNTLEGDGIAVTGLAFDPTDSTRLAAGNWDGSIRLWDLDAEQLTARYTGHFGPVTAIDFNADGSELITSSLDGAVHIWRAADGWLKAVLRGAGSPLSGVDYTAASSQIASVGLDGGVEFWSRDGRVEAFIAARDVPAEAPQIVAQPTIVPTRPSVPLINTPQPTLQGDLIFPTATPIPPLPGPTAAPARPTQAPAIVQAPPAQGTSFSLPTVNIYSGLTSFPIEGNTWAIDPWEAAVGHFQGTAWVDYTGNIVLGGHSEYPDGTRGIFNGLYGVNIGDPIYLTVNGEQRRYVVTEKREVDYRNLDPVRPTADNRLTLITCDIPSFDPNASIYWERLVVVAVLA